MNSSSLWYKWRTVNEDSTRLKCHQLTVVWLGPKLSGPHAYIYHHVCEPAGPDESLSPELFNLAALPISLAHFLLSGL